MPKVSLITKLVTFLLLLGISFGYNYAYFKLPAMLTLPVGIALTAWFISRPRVQGMQVPVTPAPSTKWYWPLIISITLAILAGIYFFPFAFITSTYPLSTALYISWSIIAALLTTIRMFIAGEQHPQRFLLVYVILLAALYGVLINYSYLAI
jgi:hypothetical protein